MGLSAISSPLRLLVLLVCATASAACGGRVQVERERESEREQEREREQAADSDLELHDSGRMPEPNPSCSNYPPLQPQRVPGGASRPMQLPSPAGCGDGVLDEDEYCDDGNWDDGDGCWGNCLGIDLGFLCPCPGALCFAYAHCGDGETTYPEQCDDGDLSDGDGCDSGCRIEPDFKCTENPMEPSACVPTVCGDGIVEGTEVCEDSLTPDCHDCQVNCWGLSSQCEEIICGDRIAQDGFETCDDGNRLNGDGCSSICEIEEGFTCEHSPVIGEVTSCRPICGDGILALGEQCDTGIGATSYNFCSADCTLSEFCGDGIVQEGEMCDDADPQAPADCVGCRLIIIR
ncbi:MAG: DUF4215 domain-containing protein [Polyangiaceae bacterium]|nr:DUF4215 domain-containing protein [Polyangiaceae bacterium]